MRCEADVFARLPRGPLAGVHAGQSLRPGRRGCCHPRPPQTRTCRFPASGSSQESFADGCVANDAIRHSLNEEHLASPAALSGTMKALRLPTRVSTVAYLFRFRCPRDPSSFVSAIALPEGRRPLPGPGVCSAGYPSFRLALAWTRVGSLRSSGDPSRTSAPFQDPGRTDAPSPYRSRRCCPRWLDGEGFSDG